METSGGDLQISLSPVFFKPPWSLYSTYRRSSRIHVSRFRPRIRPLARKCSSTCHQEFGQHYCKFINSTSCHFGGRTTIRQHLSGALLYPLLGRLSLASVVYRSGHLCFDELYSSPDEVLVERTYIRFLFSTFERLALSGGGGIRIYQNQMSWNSTVKYSLENLLTRSTNFTVIGALVPPA